MEAIQKRSNTSMQCFRENTKKLMVKMINLIPMLKKIGQDDPRRIIHSFKIGLALTLVSIFYYVNPIYGEFGVSAMWAVLTVVVVIEYSVGATLSKGFNRTVGTIVAGALGIGAHQIASLCGDKAEPIVLGIFVFLLSCMAAYSKFIPEIKAKYEYGVTVFILTFSLVAVSSYRVDELVQMSHQRVSTIAIGVSICVFCSIFVMPVWAGEDLHNLVSSNLDKLANSIKGIGELYFNEVEGDGVLESKLCTEYKNVLNSKAVEDSLANFAGWEPSHGRFSFRHPWKQYQKINGLIRQCAYSIEVLQNYIITTSAKYKGTKDTELHHKIRTAFTDMSMQSSNTLSSLASSIGTMSVPSTCNEHLNAAIEATVELKVYLSEQSAERFLLPLEIAVASSLLMDVVDHVCRISFSVQELARLATFKRLHGNGSVKVVSGDLDGEVVNIVVE